MARPSGRAGTRTLVVTLLAVESPEFALQTGTVPFRSWAGRQFLNECAPAVVRRALQNACEGRCAHDFAVITNDKATKQVLAAPMPPCIIRCSDANLCCRQQVLSESGLDARLVPHELIAAVAARRARAGAYGAEEVRSEMRVRVCLLACHPLELMRLRLGAGPLILEPADVLQDCCRELH
jgi:hypothetical protein